MHRDHTMGRRLRIGNVLGVEVAVDWSWVFTLVLAASTLVTLGSRALPALHPALSTLLGGAAAIGLFASLVLHEIAHGLAARACGVPVRRLTLFLFGGITDVERAPASPRTEAIAALLAPLANAVVGAAAFGLGTLLTGPGRLLVMWLAAANLAIAAINLLPAFPLDGGRLVRAAVWRATDDMERATRLAAWGGQVIGWAVVLLGVTMAFAAHRLSVAAGMWVAFIGWFLASAAAQAYQGVVAQEALAGVSVARLMRRRFRAVPADVSVATAVRAFLGQSGAVTAVVDGERFVGVVSTEMVKAVRPAAWRSTLVGQVAVSGEDLAISPHDELSTAFRSMGERGVDSLPVIECGRLVGLLERDDVARWIEAFAASPTPMSLKEHG